MRNRDSHLQANVQTLALTLLNNDCRVFIGRCDCGVFVCIMSYFVMSDCSPVFNQGDMEIMRRRMTLMIMTTSCSMIEDPTSMQIQIRQNHYDEHMRLHRTLRNTSGGANTNSQNQQRISVTIHPQSMIRLQEALDNRFLNDGNTVQCPIVGCGGQQALKIGIEKTPAILVIETTATVNERDTIPLSCIDDIERNLTVQGTKYALVQVILHNGSHYRGITVLDNQNVLYDGKFCDEFRSIGDTVKFSSKEMDKKYRVSCLWYRKVFNKKESPSYPLPVYPPFTEMTHPTHAMDYDIINENATCGMEKPQHGKGSTVDKTPKIKK